MLEGDVNSNGNVSDKGYGYVNGKTNGYVNVRC